MQTAAGWSSRTYAAMAEIALTAEDGQLATRLLALPADRFETGIHRALKDLAEEKPVNLT